MSKITPIPDFTTNPESMATALRAMKMAVEQLAGAKQGYAQPAMMFLQPYPPTPSQGFVRGSLWLDPNTNALKWYDGVIWKAVV